jgi:hypothetical protein
MLLSAKIMISKKIVILAVANSCLVLFEASLAAQSTPVGGPPRPPAQGQQEPQSKMRPTGLAANGGTISHDVYTNSIYGFSLKLPPGWAVVPPQDPNSLQSESSQPEIMKKAQIVRTILVVTENAPMKKSFQRKSIQIFATRLLGTTSENTPQDYLAFSERNAKEKNMPVEYLGDPTEVEINGQKLWKLSSTDNSQGAAQHVDQYVIARGAILVQFMLVSPDEAGLKDMQPSIQSLQFPTVPKKPASTAKKKKPASTTTPNKTVPPASTTTPPANN